MGNLLDSLRDETLELDEALELEAEERQRMSEEDLRQEKEEMHREQDSIDELLRKLDDKRAG